MIPASFEYYRAGSLSEAFDLIEKFGDEGKVLAGGHSLIPMLKLRFARYSALIDIGRLEELKYIKEENGIIKIGALTTHREVEKSPLIREKLPVLSLCASEIADVQVRNMGTIGGSIAHADPSADYIPTIQALEATIVVKSKNGERSIPADEFFVGTFSTALEPNELIVEIQIPTFKPNEKGYYLKVAHPATGFAIANCAVRLSVSGGTIEDARVALGGFVTVAYRDKRVEDFLKGKPVNMDTIQEASDMVAEDRDDIIGDYYADEEYRKNLAKAVFRKAMKGALGI